MEVHHQIYVDVQSTCLLSLIRNLDSDSLTSFLNTPCCPRWHTGLSRTCLERHRSAQGLLLPLKPQASPWGWLSPQRPFGPMPLLGCRHWLHSWLETPSIATSTFMVRGCRRPQCPAGRGWEAPQTVWRCFSYCGQAHLSCCSRECCFCQLWSSEAGVCDHKE